MVDSVDSGYSFTSDLSANGEDIASARLMQRLGAF